MSWDSLLRAIASSLRGLAQAYALLLNRPIMPLAMLRVWDVAMSAYNALASRDACPGDRLRSGLRRQRRCHGRGVCSAARAVRARGGGEVRHRATHAGHASSAARDADAQFTFGLELMLASLTPRTS